MSLDKEFIDRVDWLRVILHVTPGYPTVTVNFQLVKTGLSYQLNSDSNRLVLYP
jgi:hypothetical protein